LLNGSFYLSFVKLLKGVATYPVKGVPFNKKIIKKNSKLKRKFKIIYI
jgi:hypothetical protein